MSALNNTSILYLDDVEDHLNLTADFFKSKGVKINITNSVEEAENKIKNEKIDIFLSDLRLNEIKYPHGGNFLLNKLRPAVPFVFLGLLTAFHGDLKPNDREILSDNMITIYHKDQNPEAFYQNLENDFSLFQRSYINIKSEDFREVESKFYLKYCNTTINHLKQIQNQDTVVPVKGHRNFKVRELIREIQYKTEAGRLFVDSWMETITLMNNIKEKHNNNA